VADKLKELGLRVNLYETEKGRTNVVGVLKGSGGGKNFLLYSGHLDVVPPGNLEEWEFDPFSGKLEGDKIHGRGTADHKGTVAASLFALQSILESNVRLKGDVVFVAAADEEMLGHKGAGFLVRNKYVYGDMGIGVINTGGEYIGIASMGYLWPKITVIGKAVHGAHPEKGINAIDKAADLIKALHSLKLTKKNKLMPTKGSAGILSVTMINSGVKTNIIPGKAEISLDRRLVPGETPEEALSQIEGVIQALQSKDKDFCARIEVLDSGEGSLLSEDEPIVSTLRNNIKNILGITPVITGWPGISDNRHFINGAKIPMVSWGPKGSQPMYRMNISTSLSWSILPKC
jgi:acetylornithine deacetylase/succinyl-diaminopimelate desuccinylase family protein